MLRASIRDKNNPVLIAGISEQNVIRLKNNQPIRASFRSFGLNIPGEILLIYGTTEQAIEKQIRSSANSVDVGIVSDAIGYVDPKLAAHTEIFSKYQKVLICTVGLPRSGKSTWAKSQAWPIVCPDAVRLAIHGHQFIQEAESFVWATVRAMVNALFMSGHQIVILDACNNTRKRRDEWKSDKWATFFKVVETSKEDCILRVKQDTDIEQMMNMIQTIERMAEQHEPLQEDELRFP